MFGNAFLWPSDQFWKICRNLQKVVGNLQKIITFYIIKIKLHGHLEIRKYLSFHVEKFTVSMRPCNTLYFHGIPLTNATYKQCMMGGFGVIAFLHSDWLYFLWHGTYICIDANPKNLESRRHYLMSQLFFFRFHTFFQRMNITNKNYLLYLQC